MMAEGGHKDHTLRACTTCTTLFHEIKANEISRDKGGIDKHRHSRKEETEIVLGSVDRRDKWL